MKDQSVIVVELKRHFNARWTEWFMAGFAFCWGLYVVFHPELFTQEATKHTLAGLASMTGSLPPAAVWGAGPMVLGMVRAATLFINGTWTRTPLIRLGMSFASAFIWTQVFIGFLKTGIPNTGLIPYFGYVVMDTMSAYRAATDTVYAEKVRHETKQDKSRGHRNRSIA